MRLYAKCIDGQEEAARRRIERALGLDRPDADEPPAEEPSQAAQSSPGSAPGTLPRICHDE